MEYLAENQMAFQIFWNPYGFFAKPYGFHRFWPIFPISQEKCVIHPYFYQGSRILYYRTHDLVNIFFIKNPLILMEGFFSCQNLRNPWNLPNLQNPRNLRNPYGICQICQKLWNPQNQPSMRNLQNLRNPRNPYGFSKGNI
jgi:hypothetical protein